MILTFVVDATGDVLGVTRLHHVALTVFFWGGFLGCDIDVRCGCYRRCSWCHAFASCGTNSFFFFGGFLGWAYVWRSNLDVQVNMPRALGEIC